MSTTQELVERLTEWANGCEREAAADVTSAIGFVARKEAVQLRAAALRLAELERENAALREALKPFAEYAAEQLANWIPPHVASDDATPVWGGSYNQECSVYIGDLRRAAALAGSGEK
jgi:hypothetical protein